MENLQPKLRFPEFEGEWKYDEIGNLLSIQSGRDYKHLGKGNIPVYGTGGLMLSVDDYLYDGKSVCIGRKGTIDKPMLLSGKFWTVDTLFYSKDFNNVIPEFVFLQFLRINWKNHNEAGGVPSLSKKIINKIKISIPSLPEQTKIADFLGAVDKQLELLTTKKEKLQLYKKGVMQKLFSQEIRFKKEDNTNYPEWEEKTLGEIGEIVSGLTYSPDNISENGVLVLRSSNIQDNKLSFLDNVYVEVKKYNPVKKNDILICVRNGSKDLIGKNALITKDIEGCAFGAFMTVYRSQYNLFISQWMQHKEFKKYVHKNLGATINSINGNDLKKFKLNLPNEEEQTKIADFLSAIDNQIEAVNNQITKTENYKKGLLQQMFV